MANYIDREALLNSLDELGYFGCEKWAGIQDVILTEPLVDGAIVLTKSQIDNLMEFFELKFVDLVRGDEEVDNINYIVDMCDIFKKLTAAKEMVGAGNA